jgi:hypothetical protein
MQTLPLPYEVKATFRVPRQKAERAVSKFKNGISFPGLLPNALMSSDAGIEPDSGDGAETTLWVLFKPHTHREAPRSIKTGSIKTGLAKTNGAGHSEPVPESAFDDFLLPQKDED